MVNLTKVERIQILIYVGFGDKKRTLTEACLLFNTQHTHRLPITIATLGKAYKRFWMNNLVSDLQENFAQ